MRGAVRGLLAGVLLGSAPAGERELVLEELGVLRGDGTRFDFWFPAGAEELVVPVSGGVVVDAESEALMGWLRGGSPWNLMELPAVGARYGEETLVVLLPWPQYARLVVEGERVGVRFELPERRPEAAPVEVVVRRGGRDPMDVARRFREWRAAGKGLGAVPVRRPLSEKVEALGKVERLFGAPHFYLWGPALFSRHDVPRNRWVAFAKALAAAPDGEVTGRFSAEQRKAVGELAGAEWPMQYLTVQVAGAIDVALREGGREGFAKEFGAFVRPVATWGDGLSRLMLESLEQAGIERAVMVLSDLYGRSLRPDVAAYAEELGYLLGPYDSYHSVHSPDAGPDDTWETAQFDREAFETGRVINADGTGHAGFKGRGYHFAPRAAWPYVRGRVGGIQGQVGYSTWFVDCDATGECFEDYGEAFGGTKIDDLRERRARLRWLEGEHRLVVGSEGGSALFADVIHFGHGVHTPYIGHLDPRFRDRESPHYLGRHWPPDTPEQSFKPVALPERLRTPFFDPSVRVPLYQMALGDEVVATHHWSFDSLKFEGLEGTRALLEMLYLVPPMYHLNREAWPKRKGAILKHLAFWGPLHRELATAEMVGFEVLSADRQVQRTRFATASGEVRVTVNFGAGEQIGLPGRSARVDGGVSDGATYRVE